MSERVEIEALMAESGVKFGTSGARGLVVQMTDRVCAAYAQAFLEFLHDTEGLSRDTPVAIAGDLRPSTPRIVRAVAVAAARLGHPIEFSGFVPSPAVALRGLLAKCPAIMVTGSHIPDDRNGIKFNTPSGEISKKHEEGIRGRLVTLPDVFDEAGALVGMGPEGDQLPPVNPAAIDAYRSRYVSAFGTTCLEGSRIGVYGHSAVGREFLVDLYRALGAKVTPLGFSEKFIPVDTEAIRDEDAELAKNWAKDGEFDAIVSTDGDSDRPLTSDEKGVFLRGDVTGIVTAQFLNADAIATPVSCNTAAEKCGSFNAVVRTRIGSPFVIAGMEKALSEGSQRVVGYEANGGFLSASDLKIEGGNSLPALPTRDAVVVHLAVILSAKRAGKSISEFYASLPARFTASDRDQSFAQERSASLLELLRGMSEEQLSNRFALGKLIAQDDTDGLRLTFRKGDAEDEIVHLRPSGNAPELRCYGEAKSKERAAELVKLGLGLAAELVP